MPRGTDYDANSTSATRRRAVQTEKPWHARRVSLPTEGNTKILASRLSTMEFIYFCKIRPSESPRGSTVLKTHVPVVTYVFDSGTSGTATGKGAIQVHRYFDHVLSWMPWQTKSCTSSTWLFVSSILFFERLCEWSQTAAQGKPAFPKLRQEHNSTAHL